MSDLRYTTVGPGALTPLSPLPCLLLAPAHRYCVSSRPSVCVLEAILGTPLRLRQPGGIDCLHFDGSLQALQTAACNASEPKQQWSFDAATLVFRHATDSRRCIDYFVAHAYPSSHSNSFAPSASASPPLTPSSRSPP